MSVIEVFLSLFGLLKASQFSGALAIFSASVMTLSKTILFFAYAYFDKDGAEHSQASVADYWLFFILPTALWIIFPALTARNLAGQLARQLDEAGRRKKQ